LGNAAPATGFWFSPDSKTLAYENGDKIVLWDMAAGRERAVLVCPGPRVVALADDFVGFGTA